MFLLTGYRADSNLMRAAGVQLNDRDAPVYNPETFETNVPGLFVAGGAVAGMDTGNIFIENGRFHGEKIVEVIADRLRLAAEGSAGQPEPEPEALLVRDVRAARRARHHDLHLEQLDERLGAASAGSAARAAPASRAARGRDTAPAR